MTNTAHAATIAANNALWMFDAVMETKPAWIQDHSETCPKCGHYDVYRGAGYPGADYEELRCMICDYHWTDCTDE